MLTRRETTKFLNGLLEKKLSNQYYSKEVSLDYGTANVRRIDYLAFAPQNTMSVSGVEKGEFTCYEVKSCREDVFSGNGLNFVGEKNYIVTTMECYASIVKDIRSGKLDEHIRKCNPQSVVSYGVLVAVPASADKTTEARFREFERPTPIETDTDWTLSTIIPCIRGPRTRSLTELLFLMLRSKK